LCVSLENRAKDRAHIHGTTARQSKLRFEGLVDDTVPGSRDQVRDLNRLTAFVYDLKFSPGSLYHCRNSRNGTFCRYEVCMVIDEKERGDAITCP
jgi:hypothetical protein